MGGVAMRRTMVLEYWPDEGGWVGRLKDVPGVFSQGDTLAELEENVRDAYLLILEDEEREAHAGTVLKEIEVEI
jgi:predicted RNase H-like HicB family nuclease